MSAQRRSRPQRQATWAGTTLYGTRMDILDGPAQLSRGTVVGSKVVARRIQSCIQYGHGTVWPWASLEP